MGMDEIFIPGKFKGKFTPQDTEKKMKLNLIKLKTQVLNPPKKKRKKRKQKKEKEKGKKRKKKKILRKG